MLFIVKKQTIALITISGVLVTLTIFVTMQRRIKVEKCFRNKLRNSHNHKTAQDLTPQYRWREMQKKALGNDLFLAAEQKRMMMKRFMVGIYWYGVVINP